MVQLYVYLKQYACIPDQSQHIEIIHLVKVRID